MFRGVYMNKLRNSFIFFFLFSLALPATAHDYHFSIVEIANNERAQTVEFVHRYMVRDVALAVNKGEHYQFDEQATKAYLNSHFNIVNRAGEAVPLSFVGMEADVQYLNIYQEVSWKELGELEFGLDDRMMLKVEPAQINTINIVSGDFKRTVHLNKDNQRTWVQFKKAS